MDSSTWTIEENRLFSWCLAGIDEDDPEQFEKMAAAVPGKTVEQVKAHYERLMKAGADSDQSKTSQSCKKGGRGGGMKKGIPWTADEHRLFLEGLSVFGRGDWRSISRNFVMTRTPTQIASHAQKYFERQQNSAEKKGGRKRSSIHDITVEDMTKVPPPTNGGGDQQSVKKESEVESDQVQKDQDLSVESTWTSEEDRLFTLKLAVVPENDPERWQKIADAIPGKTVEQVRVYYQKGSNNTPWTAEEHRRFMHGVNVYGRDKWTSISRNCVITRTPAQVAAHARKYFRRHQGGGGGGDEGGE